MNQRGFLFFFFHLWIQFFPLYSSWRLRTPPHAFSETYRHFYNYTCPILGTVHAGGYQIIETRELIFCRSAARRAGTILFLWILHRNVFFFFSPYKHRPHGVSVGQINRQVWFCFYAFHRQTYLAREARASAIYRCPLPTTTDSFAANQVGARAYFIFRQRKTS